VNRRAGHDAPRQLQPFQYPARLYLLGHSWAVAHLISTKILIDFANQEWDWGSGWIREAAAAAGAAEASLGTGGRQYPELPQSAAAKFVARSSGFSGREGLAAHDCHSKDARPFGARMEVGLPESINV